MRAVRRSLHLGMPSYRRQMQSALCCSLQQAALLEALRVNARLWTSMSLRLWGDLPLDGLLSDLLFRGIEGYHG